MSTFIIPDKLTVSSLDKDADYIPVWQGAAQKKATAQQIVSSAKLFSCPKDYGALANGVADDSAAIVLAQADGDIIFTPGVYRVSSNITLTVPLNFMPGASLSVDNGVTVIIKAPVESARQKIFSGLGTISLAYDAAVIGSETAHYAHISWFGVQTGAAGDQSAAIQRCLDSMGTNRECYIDLDVGNYRVDHDITTPRACHLIGRGTRLTAFNVTNFVGTTVFTTADTGCRFQGFQFENQGAGHPTCYIHAAHTYTEIEDVGIANPICGILVTQLGCRLRHIRALGGDNATAGSALIKIEGTACSVDDVYLVGTVGPESIVVVGSPTYAVADFSVTNVEFSSPSIGRTSLESRRIDTTRHNTERQGAWRRVGSSKGSYELQQHGQARKHYGYHRRHHHDQRGHARVGRINSNS